MEKNLIKTDTTEILKIGVVGLGYVGLPLACLLSSKFSVLGFDKDAEKLAKIASGSDPCGEVDSATLTGSNLLYSADPVDLKNCEIIIVCVPTPVYSNNEPNFSILLDAARVIGKYMRSGTTVVFESTVYPGVTETLCADALMEGGLKRSDFKLGYSPERVNPGDKKHRIENIVKLVSGEDQETLEKLMHVYGAIAPVHGCPSIKVAEATKLFENVQRDVNIGYVNEFTTLCRHVGISMQDVLAAAKTKWNALSFFPGMVGGDCIYTDPYYALRWRWETMHSRGKDSLIFQARQINYRMPYYVAQLLSERIPEDSRLLILGLTFKQNVRDCRNSGALKLAQIMSGTHEVYCYDPLAPASEHKNPDWDNIPQVDVIFVAVDHDIFKSLDLRIKLKESGTVLTLTDLF